MSTFIVRKEELLFLQEKYDSKNAEFLIVYGRRRIGKTETLSHFCSGKNPVFFTCAYIMEEK